MKIGEILSDLRLMFGWKLEFFLVGPLRERGIGEPGASSGKPDEHNQK